MKPRPLSTRRVAHIAVPVRVAILVALLAAVGVGCASTTARPPSGSPTQTAHSSTSARPTFTAFAGQWIGHGSFLVVHSDGRFTMEMRTYRTCGQDPPPCDTFSGNTITSGDVATGQLTSASGEVATGEVAHTTDPTDTPAGPIRMTLDPATDTISANNISFCGANAPSGNCGA